MMNNSNDLIIASLWGLIALCFIASMIAIAYIR